MATEIRQKPLYTFLPVGQQIIFTVENDAVDNYFNVKYIAELHISLRPINLSTSDDLIGTFKTTPNNAGVGIFDFQKSIKYSYLKALKIFDVSTTGRRVV